MNIQDTKLLDIVPEFMRDDRTVKGLCAAADAMFKQLIHATHIAWWRKYINELDADQLDDIAMQMGIPWYDDGSDVISKQNVLKNFENVLAISGTPDAVKFAVKDLFGNVEVIEWPEYGGKPYHFKISVNSKFDEETVRRFDSALSSSKNVRSIIDFLDIMCKSNAVVYVGGTVTSGSLYKLDTKNKEVRIGTAAYCAATVAIAKAERR